jgi:hypothetical protein
MTNKVKSVVFVILVAGLLMSFLTVAPTMIQNTAMAIVNSVQDQSGHVEKFRIAGKVASAQWYSENSDTYSEVSVYLVDADSKPEEYYSNPTVIVQVWEYELIEDCIVYPDGEQCHYVYEFVTDFFGFAEPKRSDFSISGSLRTASIDAVEVTGYDYVTGDEMTITLDASWIASGSLFEAKAIVL